MERTWYYTGVYNQVKPRSRTATNCVSVRVLDGSITKCMNPNHTSCFLSNSSIDYMRVASLLTMTQATH